MDQVPQLRISVRRDVAADGKGQFVLYWMNSARRTRWNFGLQQAVDWCIRLHRPLVVLETLECGGRWASARHHWFVIEGMADNARHLSKRGVLYYPAVESRSGGTRRLVERLARRACVVVADEFPCDDRPELLAQVSGSIGTRLEAVDSNGLLPMRAADRVFSRAYSFRRFLQRELPTHLGQLPKADPLAGAKLPAPPRLPDEIMDRWPPLWLGQPGPKVSVPDSTPINWQVEPVAMHGGSRAAAACLKRFLDTRLARYETDRNLPEEGAASGLSPYLHFGHVSAHEIFKRIADREEWGPDRLESKAGGSREGWWGMSAAAEGFLDQLVTWRELGYNFAWQRDDYATYDALPDWALKTLAEHARDPREAVYDLEQFEAAATHDPLWNAAERQMVREGTMHNYLRMLWGKKILHWSASPREALETMIELNNRYALDGCNPNSYSGICWVLGRYDRAWGPERPIFGKIRYMSSRNTLRKLKLRGYMERYGAEESVKRKAESGLGW